MQRTSALRLSVAAAVLTACVSPVQAVVTFEFTYFDTPGTGFNAPGSGDAFKFVLEDIAAEIGGGITQTATVKIGVAPSEFDGTGFSASAGATFIGTDPPASGFFDGEVIDRIVNGTPHPGTPGVCGGVECDGALVVDLGYIWNVDSSPGPTEIDFRSVMLHELTHILGYASFIASDGTGFNGTTPDVYTKFDSFVKTSGGALSLIDPGGFPAFGPGVFPTVLAAGTDFVGPDALAAGGVGLAASDPTHSGAVVDVMFATSPTGFVKDIWTVRDVAVLTDLGYLFGAPLVGDLDGDGFVGITDLNIILAAWNESVPPGDPLADPSGDGFVGIEDLGTVLGNWNAGTPPTGSPVPEPGSFVVMGVAVLSALRRRRPA
jgi:hypothetical protein